MNREEGVTVNSTVAPSKRCPTCSEVKSRDEFHKNRATHDGLASYCKPCMKVRRTRERAENPERDRERQRRIYYANQEARKQRAYDYYHSRATVEQKAEWKRRSNERRRSTDRSEEWMRRQARKLAATVEKVDYSVVFERDQGLCYLCEEAIDGPAHFDHIVALCQGGLHAYSNIAATHPVCNMSKNGSALQDLPEVLRNRAGRKLKSIANQGETNASSKD
jgi:hypothetical protein